LSLMLIKRGIEVMVGAALMVALLFVVPAVAQAQERQEGAPPASVVVRPGDTLWSISEERLGPNATPQRIAREVERIYALNRHRIGPDPNQIFSGQELSLPPAGGSSSTEEAATKNMAQKTAQEAATGTVEGAQQQANHPNLPKAPASAATAAVPAVGSLSTDTQAAAGTLVGIFAEARATADGRRLLGWGIIALTLVVCALMAWKLPMRRSLSDDLEVWVIPSGHQGRPHASLQAYDAWSSGFSANGAASSEGARDVPGMRQTADTEFGGLDASREWEIVEPIRRAVGSMPLVPGPARSRALWEAKPLAQDALATLAFREQRRRLSPKELRQARAIRRFLAALEEEEAVYQGSQGTRANGSEANGSEANGSEANGSEANGSEAEATATKNGASRGTHI
jgi:LysM repeat protein